MIPGRRAALSDRDDLRDGLALGGWVLWKKVRGLMGKKEGADEIR